MSFAYNDDGIRTSKTVDSSTHFYNLNGSQIITEEWDGNLLVYLYDADGSPMGMRYRKESYGQYVYDTFWFDKNLQGDIVAVYNAEGTKLISYKYDAWGNVTTTYHNGCTSSSPASYNPFRYRGYYYDTDLEMYYLQSRYYDPVIGRFINADNYVSTGQGLLGSNMYAYCLNNPVNGCDPCGTCFHRWDFWNVCEKCANKTAKDFVKEAVDGYIDMQTQFSPLGPIPSLLKAMHYGRNIFNREYTEAELESMGHSALGEKEDKFHQNNQKSGRNRKYVIGDWFSSENVFFYDGTLNNTPEDLGTFNVYFGESKLGNYTVHLLYDVLPYMLWGNNESDSTTFIDRVIMLFE